MTTPHPPLLIGLTGGVASGKSTVADLFCHHGVRVIDSDQIARQQVTRGTPALGEISHHFGPSVLTAQGELDRPAMRQLIFSNPDAKRALEAILHPRIKEAMKSEIANYPQEPYLILAIPLLFECGWQEIVDRTLVINVSRDQQQQRLMQRDKISPELAQAMINAQIDAERRRHRADDLIDNRHHIAELVPQIARLHEFYLALASARG
jgi:dephospho-CoA kinase